MRFIFPVAIFIFLFGCNDKNPTTLAKKYEAEGVLSTEETDSFKYSVMRYAGQLPAKANHSTKFDATFDHYYKELSGKHQLVYYFPDQKGNIYFLLTRRAPSLHEKKVAIGGKMTKTANGEILFYEEVFRTWKMTEEDLQNKAAMLFLRMVENKDLSPYYTINSKGEEYIEFPDEKVYFDTLVRRWVVKNDSVQ